MRANSGFPPTEDADIYRLVMYYPVSSLVTLFANVLQNPQDPHAAKDLVLMHKVVEFLRMVLDIDELDEGSQRYEDTSVARMLVITREFKRIAQLVLEKAEREALSKKKRKTDDASRNTNPPRPDGQRQGLRRPFAQPHIPSQQTGPITPVMHSNGMHGIDISPPVSFCHPLSRHHQMSSADHWNPADIRCTPAIPPGQLDAVVKRHGTTPDGFVQPRPGAEFPHGLCELVRAALCTTGPVANADDVRMGLGRCERADALGGRPPAADVRDGDRIVACFAWRGYMRSCINNYWESRVSGV